MDLHTFPCGCQFEIIGPSPFKKGGLPALKLDYDNIPLDCKATYDLLSTGKTRLCFQLELGAGRQGCKELKPENLEHLTGLASALRPGASNNIDENGISTSRHYYLRKNKEEEVAPYHPVVDEVLKETYNLLLFQESSIRMVEVIAGFNKQEADTMRKASAKKLADEMSKVKKKFLKGAKEQGIVTDAQAEEIFGWIEKSNRYSFNRSHALNYSKVTYYCAYAKQHFPIQAFCSWLTYANDKPKPLEEFAELIDDAKIMGIEVYPPNIIDLELDFYTDGEIINYGISNVKGIGATSARKIIHTIRDAEIDFKPLKEWTWYEFLILVGNDLSKTAMENLISVGAFRNLKASVTRAQMLKEYEALTEISKSKSELPWIRERIEQFNNITNALEAMGRPKKEGGGTNDARRAGLVQSRVGMLRNPILPYRDNPSEIANDETRLLGIAITCSIADSKPGERWTATCKECVGSSLPKLIILKIKVEDVRENTIKKGKEENIGKVMAYIKVSDSTCSLGDISVFPETYEKYRNFLIPGRLLEIQLDKSYKGNRLHVKDVWEI